MLRALGFRDAGHELPSVYLWKMRAPHPCNLDLAALSPRHPRGSGYAFNPDFAPTKEGRLSATGSRGGTISEAARIALAEIYEAGAACASDPKRDAWDVMMLTKQTNQEAELLRVVIALDAYLSAEN